MQNPFEQTGHVDAREEKKPQEQQGAPLNIPMIEATVRMCTPFLTKEKRGEEIVQKDDEHLEHDQELLRLFLTEYFSEAMNNAEMYTSPELNASFLYTRVSLSQLAQTLYKKAGLPREEHAVTEQKVHQGSQALRRPKKEFIFGTMFSVGSAHSFHWTEHAIDQLAKKLPEALEALSRGEAVEEYEVYGMGNPGGEFGDVLEQFLQEAGKKPFEHTGKLYAEFVGSITKNTCANIDLWGVSMGGLMAAATAKSLIEQGRAVQDAKRSSQEESAQKLPNVRVLMQSPVGLDSLWKNLQILPGFLAELALMSRDEYAGEVAGAEGDLIGTAKEMLRKKDIYPTAEGEDLDRKQKLILRLIGEMLKGVTIPPELKINMISGWRDPLTLSLKTLYEAYINREENAWQGEELVKNERSRFVDHGNGLGNMFLPRARENHRRFGMGKGHDPGFINSRTHYFPRLARAVEAMAARADQK